MRARSLVGLLVLLLLTPALAFWSADGAERSRPGMSETDVLQARAGPFTAPCGPEPSGFWPDVVEGISGCRSAAPTFRTRMAAPARSVQPMIASADRTHAGAVRYGKALYLRAERMFEGARGWQYGHGSAGRVQVLQKLAGEATWTELDASDTARYTGRATALGNARYWFRYAGERRPVGRFASSSTYVDLRVQRHVRSRGGSGTVLLGSIEPGYAGRPVTVELKSCGTCEWEAVRQVTTDAESRFRAELRAPDGWRYRITVAADSRFAASYSDTWQVAGGQVVRLR